MITNPLATRALAHPLVRHVVSAEEARALRFLAVGGSTAVLQLVTLAVLVHHGLHPLAANSVAILLAVETNFVLSNLFTWRGRRAVARRLWHRWLMFHASMAIATVLNMAVFTGTRPFLPLLLASAAGICCGAVVNYFIGDRLVFAHRRHHHHHAAAAE